MRPKNRLKIIALVLLTVVIIGTLGFWLIERMSLLDALYMTVITVSTVGYKEVVPFSTGGKIFAIFLITIGVGTVFYAVGTFINVTIQEYLRHTFGRRRMEKKIERISGHYIIAGYGRVGKNVAGEFTKAGKDFVVIENDPEQIPELEERGLIFIEGDATNDEVLEKAGIKRAAGLIAAIRSDADNVFIVLSARRENSKLFIVARANTIEAIDKLKTAGADRVVSPSIIGARRMAAWMLRPVVSDYLDLVGHGERLDYRLEEIVLRPDSALDNKSIQEAGIRGKIGAMILAIKRGEKLNTNPSGEAVLKAGDLLIVIGTDSQLKELEKLA